ncbi:unnamed protein product [Effrenium voratum]|nr:unnamed protein product [Effrenium voratum]
MNKPTGVQRKGPKRDGFFGFHVGLQLQPWRSHFAGPKHSADSPTLSAMMQAAFVAPSTLSAAREVQVRADVSASAHALRGQSFVGTDSDPSVRYAAASMGAMCVAVGAVRAFERKRSRAVRKAGSYTPATPVVASPQETYQEMVDKAEYLRDQPWVKTLHAGVMGGAYVGMAGLLSLMVGGNITSNFINQKAIFAALFPINLLLVLQTGGQLFTGNSATMAVGVFEKKVTLKQLMRNWAIAYVGNIIGCLLIDAVARYTGMFSAGAADMAVHTVMKKCGSTFGQTVVKGIMCNWLVCMAVWLCTMAKDLTGKMVGVWFPISMFIAIGFEHSVANMFILPAGIFSGAPLSWADVLVKNLIPVTIGNAIAGAFVVGAGMSFSFGRLGKKEAHPAQRLHRAAIPGPWQRAAAALLGLGGTSALALYGVPVFIAAFISGMDDSQRPLAVGILVAPIVLTALAHAACGDAETAVCPKWVVPHEGPGAPGPVGAALALAAGGLRLVVPGDGLRRLGAAGPLGPGESEEEDVWPLPKGSI